MHQKAFGGRAPPRPAGELKRSPDLLAAIVGSTSKGRGGEGRGGEGRGGRKGMWRGGEREKEEGKGEKG